MGKVAIIIVNWNGLKFLDNCLKAVFKQSYKNFDVYLIDNASSDESTEFVRKNFSNVKLIKVNYNSGFAEGNNIGIKEAFEDSGVEFIVCLNNDTVVEQDWLLNLVNKVDYEKMIDMVGSLSLLSNGQVYSIGARFNKNLNDLSIGYGSSPEKYNDKAEIFSPHGVSVLYTKRLLEDVGLFDEDFFAYCEEFDLGLRARKIGYKAVFSSKSVLTHLVSQSSGGMANPFKAYLNKRNSYFVAIKNFSITDLFLFPFRDIYCNVSNIFNKRENSVAKLKEKIGILGIFSIMFRVYWSVFLKSPKMLTKRFKKRKF